MWNNSWLTRLTILLWTSNKQLHNSAIFSLQLDLILLRWTRYSSKLRINSASQRSWCHRLNKQTQRNQYNNSNLCRKNLALVVELVSKFNLMQVRTCKSLMLATVKAKNLLHMKNWRKNWTIKGQNDKSTNDRMNFLYIYLI